MPSFVTRWLPSFLRPRRTPRKSRRPGVRLAVEALEDRATPSASSLDLDFGVNGVAVAEFPDTHERFDVGMSMVVQPDGKILVVGTSLIEDSYASYATVVRYNLDGTLDTTFGAENEATGKRSGMQIVDLGGLYDEGRDVAVLADGKILVSGTSAMAPDPGVDRYGAFVVARLNADGSLDDGSSSDSTPGDSFGTDGKQTLVFGDGDDATCHNIAVQVDGKILLAGSTTVFTLQQDGTYAESTNFAVARLNANGSLDNGLNGDSTPGDSFGSYGSLTLDVGTGQGCIAMAVQADGKILLRGSSWTVARLNVDGSLDDGLSGDSTPGDSFGTDGQQTLVVLEGVGVGTSMAVQADGKILLGGGKFTSSAYGGAVVRLNADGSLDDGLDGDSTPGDSFGTDGLQDIIGPAYNLVMDMAVQADGKIVLGGVAVNLADLSFNFMVARLNADGSVDDGSSTDSTEGDSFGNESTQMIDIGVSSACGSIAVQSDGKIVLGGITGFLTDLQGDYVVVRLLGNDDDVDVEESTTTATGGTFVYNGSAHAGSGSVNVVGGVVTLSYEGINGTVYTATATAPTNAGEYRVTATYAGDADHSPSSGTATLTITKAMLTGQATTQAALNLAKNGALAWTVSIDAASIVGGESVASLFNGAKFTLTINGAVYSLQSTASVVNGVIYVNWIMDAGLKDALDNWTTAYNTSASKAAAGTLTVSAITQGGNYTFSDDFLTKLFYKA